MNNKGKILLVEDDANFGIVMRDYLRLNKYEVDLAENGKVGYGLFKKNTYHLCILDIMMPEMDGFTLAEEIVKTKKNVPFIFLTAKGLKEDLLKGYKTGASDYLNKPFDPEILLLKINVLLNSNIKQKRVIKETYSFDKYKLNTQLRRLDTNETSIPLSPKESELLAFLLENKNTLVHRKEVLERIWNEDSYFTARSMDVYINKLRKKFKSDPGITLENIRGKGFILGVK